MKHSIRLTKGVYRALSVLIRYLFFCRRRTQTDTDRHPKTEIRHLCGKYAVKNQNRITTQKKGNTKNKFVFFRIFRVHSWQKIKSGKYAVKNQNRITTQKKGNTKNKFVFFRIFRVHSWQKNKKGTASCNFLAIP
jgi:hypothetical protein